MALSDTVGTGNPVIANTDRYQIDVGQTLYFNTRYLLFNDSGADGGLDVIALGPVSSEGVAVSWGPEGSAMDGTAIYRPRPGWEGVDTLRYTVGDADGSRAEGTVEIAVGRGANAPAGSGNPVTAVTDHYKVEPGKALWFNTRYLTWNDRSVDGGLKVVALAATSERGVTVSWDETGTAVYRAPAGFSGIDRLTYTVQDADGSKATGTVEITVGTGETAPPPPAESGNPVFAHDDAYRIDAGKALWVNSRYLTWNDKGADGGLKVVAVDSTSEFGGTLSWAADGTTVYRAPPGFAGIDRFGYTVEDKDGSRDTAMVVVTVGDGTATPPAPPPPSTGGATISFADALEPVTADLAAGVATQVVRIMPMGDSHTYGVVGSYADRESGGYRLHLAEKMDAAGIAADFVGRVRSGPSTFDNQHEGYSSVQIDWLNARAAEMVNVNRPDVILLMAGNNDAAASDSPATMISQMAQLIDTLSTNAPEAKILVAGILPARPDNLVGMDPVKIAAFNAALPALVANEAAAGKHVAFVDTSSLTVDDISPLSVDKGVHLTHEGHEKLAGIWLKALEALGIRHGTLAVNQDSLAGYRNVDGSKFGDLLKGDGHSNTLRGNDGDDIIDGGAGDDLLWGGAGADRFVFAKGKAGSDRIGDFSRSDGDRISTDYKGAEIVGWGSDTLTFQTAGGAADRLEAPGHQWSTSDFLFS